MTDWKAHDDPANWPHPKEEKGLQKMAGDPAGALDTPAKQTRHWLDNSVLHNNGKIFVTFEHHETLRRGLAVLSKMDEWKLPEPTCNGNNYNEMRYDTGWNDCLQRLKEIAE